MIGAKITAVLVLYRMTAEQSECFLSLRAWLNTVPAEQAERFDLLLYDNSPEAAGDRPAFPGRLRYQHDESNGGVAAAYNAGLAMARAGASPWLMLLDQDTRLSPAYFEELQALVGMVPKEVAAIVPRLVQDGHTHSPHRLPYLSHRALPDDTEGLLQGEVSAFNSGAVLRVSVVQGFPVRYWLDFLDHVVFHQLQARGGRIWLMRTRLEHRLSTQSLGTEASVGRYQNVLLAERDFYRDFGSRQERIFYRLRRAKQFLGQLVKIPDKRFALLSARAALGLLGPSTLR
jgi:glycosyltransferase involved in cell wall biosynthesis